MVRFEWDPAKARSNVRKHGVDFADAAEALSDEAALTIPDVFPDEPRWVTLCADAGGRVLVVVYTWRREAVRIISARRATQRERHQYEDEKR